MAENASSETVGHSSDEVVTVKFRTDANETLTRAFYLDADVGSLRSHLQRLLNADRRDKISILLNGSALDDDGQSLRQLGAAGLGTFELDLRTDGGVRVPECSYYLPVMDVISVHTGRRTVVVEIENCAAGKPWLGGYRDRNTGKVYHNAAAQTDFRPRVYADVRRTDGACQTTADKAVGRAAAADKQTQTAGDTAAGSRWLRPRAYLGYRTTRSPEDARVLASVVIIQRAFRKAVARRKHAAVQRQTATSEPADVSALESKQQHFYALYTMIGKWWNKERQRIREIRAERCRKAAQMNLLKKEIKFLLEVEKQRLELKYELTKHDDVTFLNKTSKPKMFKNRNGKLLTVDTVGNQKARVLRDIYARVIEQPDGAVDRQRALQDLYAVVRDSPYKYAGYLLDAIDMEMDLTVRVRVDAGGLRSVRLRVEQLFRHFIRQPEVNPEADSYYRPTEKRVLNVYTCIRCKRNLAATDFSLESRVNRTNVCANCEWSEQVGHKHIDMAPYRRLLKAVRHDEMRIACYESECFLMQPTEVYRLVTIIWEEKSALSETNRLAALRLVRWRRQERWSPWNCVLLTRQEADVHMRAEGPPEDYYDRKFVARVTNKHLTAKLQFVNLVRAVNNRAVSHKTKPLPKNWQVIADSFSIKV